MQTLITRLNVRDGDAIIVELKKQDKSLVMVIDGGKSQYYASKVAPKLKEILKAHQKKALDIVVCTHYDSDHVGVLFPLVNAYKNDLGEVWIHE